MGKDQNIEQDICHFAGEMAEHFSLNKSIGQIYGLLYFSSDPISLGDIAKRLGMSKGNASINVRTLESWDAVHSVWQSGTRQDFYEANKDIKKIVVERVQDGLQRRLKYAQKKLESLSQKVDDTKGQPDFKEKIKSLQSLMAKSQKALMLLKVL